jgi:hypothetical protein
MAGEAVAICVAARGFTASEAMKKLVVFQI